MTAIKLLIAAAATHFLVGCAIPPYSGAGDDDAAIGTSLMLLGAASSGWAQGRQPMPMIYLMH